jgi:hypothetical protein
MKNEPAAVALRTAPTLLELREQYFLCRLPVALWHLGLSGRNKKLETNTPLVFSMQMMVSWSGYDGDSEERFETAAVFVFVTYPVEGSELKQDGT